MFLLRDLLIFIAGAEFFHTLVHIYLHYFSSFPINLKYIVLTDTANDWAILVNAIITIGLIGLAKILGTRIKRNRRE
ncbi:Uncharacterised protein [Legionella wadsworthii]|uniref:Uncharacterized protein n=1 Tax=Legionella wadsworthii TaxID=28088 RepID=A0A378P4C0_9GAMM|nr:hypothetical protein [Legionella wadsworthii]STY78961.1 Uncharacterised protein [Legionella wadsworthii]